MSLYKEITGKEISATDIEFYDTSSMLFRKKLRNDISFLTKDHKFIILIEHQSTICFNIAIRLLIYFTELIKIFIRKEELNVFSYSPIIIPTAELYVVYNGETRQNDNTQTINQNFIVDTGQIKVEVKVRNINYNQIKTSKDEKNTFVGYSFFMECVRRYQNLGFELSEAFEKAKEECLRNDLLTDYLNRKEFTSMALEVYTIEQEIQDAREEGREEGRVEGREEGREESLKETARKMFAEGFTLEVISKFVALDIDILRSLEPANVNK